MNTPTRVYKQEAVEALQELADESLQRRRWLADSVPEISSFTEAVCQLFDDTGLGEALEKPTGSPVFSLAIDDRLRELDKMAAQFDHFMDPEKQVEHPQLRRIRDLAAAILADIRAQQIDDRPV